MDLSGRSTRTNSTTFRAFRPIRYEDRRSRLRKYDDIVRKNRQLNCPENGQNVNDFVYGSDGRTSRNRPSTLNSNRHTQLTGNWRISNGVLDERHWVRRNTGFVNGHFDEGDGTTNENDPYFDSGHNQQQQRRPQNGVVPSKMVHSSQLIWSTLAHEKPDTAGAVPKLTAESAKLRRKSAFSTRKSRLIHLFRCCFHPTASFGDRSEDVVDVFLPTSALDKAKLTAYTPKPTEKLLLPQIRPCDIDKKCLIIDLDETLVHSSFKPVKNPDIVIPVEIDGIAHQVYVLKRPYVDEFLQRIGDKFECILFTASLAKYADPVADLLDKRGVFRSRLFREACVFYKGNYVKDLNRLGRDLKRVVIVDNSPASYAFHPDNAVPVQSWFEDMNDTELLEIIPLLDRLHTVDNIYTVLRKSPESAVHNGRF